jgi:hypothetical protein
MTASAFYNRVVFIPFTGGTGSFQVNAAAPGARTPGNVPIPNNTVVSYTAVSFDLTQWECGQGNYNNGFLSRDTIRESSSGNAKVNFSFAPTVQLDYHAQDIITVQGGVSNTGNPASSTNNAIVRWDGATGLLVKNSVDLVDDSGNMFFPANTKLDWAAANITVQHSSNKLTFSGNPSADAAFVFTGAPTANLIDVLRVTNTRDATPAHVAAFEGRRATPAINDTGHITYNLNNSAGTAVEYVRQVWQANNVTPGAEEGHMFWRLQVAGVLTSILEIEPTALHPSTSGLITIGSTTLPFGSVFLGSGTKIDFNAGNVTITHAASKLLFAGATNGYSFSNSVVPVSDGAANLGDPTANKWQSLYLNSGGTINFNNGNWVATHTVGVLTVGTGDLQITTAGTNAASVATVGGTQNLSNKTLTAVILGTPTSGTLTNCTGLPSAGLTLAGLSVAGRSANSSGAGGDITGTDKQVLRVSGTTLGFGAIDVSSATAVSNQLNSASMPALTGAVVSAGATLTTTETIELIVIIGDGTNVITTGAAGNWLELDFNFTIVQWTILAKQSGSISIDVWKTTFSSFDSGATHPVAADKISATAPITFTTATKAQSSTLTGWTTTVSANDVLAFNVASVTTCTQVVISLKVTKTS